MADVLHTRDYFSECIPYSDKDVAELHDCGMLFSDGRYIGFAACAKAYAAARGIPVSSCIGERNVAERKYVLYALPHPVVIRFAGQSASDARRRFSALEREVREKGYATLDLT